MTEMLQIEARTVTGANAGTTPRASVRSLPDRIIVVSDLHLGEGVDPVRGSVSGEHFFHDQEFEVWLDRLRQRAARRGRHVELVLNGDAFDFLRVVRLPETPQAVAEWRRLLAAARVRPLGGAPHATPLAARKVRTLSTREPVRRAVPVPESRRR
jgi:hypothetical protein